MTRRSPVVVAIAAAAVLLAACSPSSPDAIAADGITDERASDPVIPNGPGGAISIEAGDLFFQDLEGAAIDGAVSVTIVNIGQAEHNFRIDESAGGTLKVSAFGGDTTVGDLLLFGQPGGTQYTYYCDIPGHREAGMEGTLMVYADAADAEGKPVGTTSMG